MAIATRMCWTMSMNWGASVGKALVLWKCRFTVVLTIKPLDFIHNDSTVCYFSATSSKLVTSTSVYPNHPQFPRRSDDKHVWLLRARAFYKLGSRSGPEADVGIVGLIASPCMKNEISRSRRLTVLSEGRGGRGAEGGEGALECLHKYASQFGYACEAGRHLDAKAFCMKSPESNFAAFLQWYHQWHHDSAWRRRYPGVPEEENIRWNDKDERHSIRQQTFRHLSKLWQFKFKIFRSVTILSDATRDHRLPAVPTCDVTSRVHPSRYITHFKLCTDLYLSKAGIISKIWNRKVAGKENAMTSNVSK